MVVMMFFEPWEDRFRESWLERLSERNVVAADDDDVVRFFGRKTNDKSI